MRQQTARIGTSQPMDAARRSTDTPLSRPPLERMLKLHEVLQTGTYPTAISLAAELEVSPKSVYRDLEFMRDRLHLPLDFDWSRKGYYYTEKVAAFPTVQVTEGELFALVVAERAFQQYRGTSFEKPLLSAIRKLEQSLPAVISFNMAEVGRTISFHTRAEPVLDLEIFERLASATAARRQLELIYRKPGRREPEPRLVDPYHLANINGEWFLFAFDHLRKDIRTFVPARIRRVKETGKKFAAPEAFSLERRLRDSFGVQSGEGRHQVVLRFDSQVADFVREKRWHSSQQLKNLKNGGVELRLKLSSLSEVERWVLSWGGNAVVLQPAELAHSVRCAARRILSGYK